MVEVTWTAPDSAPQPASCKVYFRKISDETWNFIAVPCSAQNGVLEDLTEGTEYIVYVVTYLNGVSGEKSLEVSVTTPPGGATPDPVTDVIAISRLPNLIEITWTAAVSGTKPTYYKMYYRKFGEKVWQTQFVHSLVTNGVIKDLHPDTKYEVYVVPYNGIYGGKKSGITMCTTPHKDVSPLGVSNLKVNPSLPNLAEVTWDAPTSGTKPTHYKIYYRSSQEKKWESVFIHSRTTNGVIKDLRADTTYKIYVISYSGAYGGPKSKTVTITTPKKDSSPNAVSNLKVVATLPNLAEVSWTGPSSGVTPTYYKIFYRKLGKGSYKTVLVPSSSTNGVLKDLIPDTEYEVYLIAHAAGGGEGPKSRVVTVRTPKRSVSPHRVKSIQVNPRLPNLVEVTWSPPAGGPKPTFYKIFYREIVARKKRDFRKDNWLSVFVPPSKTAGVIKGLSANTMYQVYIRPYHGVRGGPKSKVVEVVTPEKQSTPRRVTALKVNPRLPTLVEVSWKPPSGGVTPTYYKMFYHEVNTRHWQSVFVNSVETDGVLKDLSANTRYEMYVVAYRGIYGGERSKIIIFNTPRDDFSPKAVTNLIANPRLPNLVEVTWSISSSDIAKPTHYKIFYRTSDESEDETKYIYSHTNSGVIRNLTPSKEYVIYIVAYNGVHDGPKSRVISVTMPTTIDLAPQAVKNLQVNARLSSLVEITWTNPSSGADPTHYKIYYRKVSQMNWQTVYVHYMAYGVVKDLVPDTKYEFYVVAYNGGFSGPRSKTVTVKTPGNDLSRKTITGIKVIARLPNLVQVTWTVSATGLKPTFYKIYYRKVGEASWSSVFVTAEKTDGVVKDLTPNTEYQIYVVAYDGGRAGPKTKIITIRTPSDAVSPKAVLNLKVKATLPTVIEVSWTPAASGVKPTYYKIYYRKKGVKNWNSIFVSSYKTKGVLKDLKENTKYEVYVVAYHGANSGPHSAAITVTTIRQHIAPKTVVNLRIMMKGSTLEVTWKPPPGGPNPTKYTVHYKNINGGTWKMITTQTTKGVIKNLAPNTKYKVYIVPHDGNTAGPKSHVMTITTMQKTIVPSVISHLKLIARKPDVLEVSWSAPHGGLKPTMYKIFYKKASAHKWQHIIIHSAATSGVIKHLSSNTKYQIYIVAHHGQNAGPKSQVAVIRTPNKRITPSVVEHMKISSQHNVIEVKWHAPGSGAKATAYAIFYRKVGQHKWQQFTASHPATSAKLTGLAQGTQYELYMVVYHGKQSGPRSGMMTITTAAMEKLHVCEDVRVGQLYPNSVKISWIAPSKGPVPTHYKVYYRRTKDTDLKFVTVGYPALSTHIKGLTHNTEYEAFVVTYKGNTEGPKCKTITFSTLTIEKTPFPVTNFKVVRKFENNVELTWDQTSKGPRPTHYKLYFRMSHKSVFQLLTFIATDKVVIPNLAYDTLYYMYVIPCNSGVQGPKSTILTVRTLSKALPAATVRSVMCKPTGPHTLEITWTPPKWSTEPTNYKIYYQEASSHDKSYAFVHSQSTKALIKSLSPATKYQVYIVPALDQQTGTKSKAIECTTSRASNEEISPSQIISNLHISSKSTDFIEVSWDISQGVHKPFKMDVYYRKVADMKWNHISVQTSESSYELRDLDRDVEYEIYCVPYKNNLPGPRTKIVSVITTQDENADKVPGVVDNVQCESTFNQILVVWDKPSSGARPTRYKIYYRKPDDAKWISATLSSSETRYAMEGLDSNQQYEIYIVAYNGKNNGEKCQTVYCITKKEVTKPGMVSNVQCKSTPDQIELSWDKPQTGARPTEYKIYCRKHGETDWKTATVSSAETKFIIKGLESKEKYEVYIVPYNGKYEGEQCETVYCITKEEDRNPSMVSNVQCKSTPDEIELSWDKPQTGVSPTEYKIYYRKRGGTDWKSATVSSAQTKYTIKGLASKEKYEMYIVPYNGKYEGEKCDTVYCITKEPNNPGMVSNVQCKATPDQIELSWDKPESGASPTEYKIYYRKAGDTDWKSATVSSAHTKYTIKDLDSKEKYEMYIVPYNGKDEGEKCETVYCITKESEKSYPGIVFNVQCKATEKQIEVSWNKPSRGPDPTQYEIYYHKIGAKGWKSIAVSSSTTKYVIKGLQSEQKYEFYIVAYNGKFIGDKCLTISCMTTEDSSKKPSAVGNMKCKATSEKIEVTWAKPSKGPKPTAYKIYYREPGDVDWQSVTVSSSKSRYVLRGVRQKQKYELYIVAYNGNYIGKKSRIISCTTKAVVREPGTVRNVKCNSRITMIDVTWSPPARGPRPSKYSVYYRKAGDSKWKSGTVISPRTNFAIRKLQGKTKYELYVIAYNTKYAGARSKTVRCTTKGKGTTTGGGVRNGHWGSWSVYGSCSRRCGGGYRYRSRSCTNPSPSAGGLNCQLSDNSGKRGRSERQRSRCHTRSCVVHGGYGSWSEWTKCSASCGVGVRTRYRSCSNPFPQGGGRDCRALGSSQHTVKCKLGKCKKTVVLRPICTSPDHGQCFLYMKNKSHYCQHWWARTNCKYMCGLCQKRR